MTRIGLRERRLLLRARFLLVLRLPLLVRHAVDDLARIRVGQADALRLRPPRDTSGSGSSGRSPARFIMSMFCTSVRSRRCSTRRRNAAASSSVRVLSSICGAVMTGLLSTGLKMARPAPLRHTPARADGRRAKPMVWDDARARAALRALFDAAVAAADPRKVLASHLPPRPDRALHRRGLRQVGRGDGGRAGGRLARRRAGGHRRHPLRPHRADQADRGDRGLASGPRRQQRTRRAPAAGARARPRPRRSRAGPDIRRRLRAVRRAGAGPDARRQAGDQSCAARLAGRTFRK